MTIRAVVVGREYKKGGGNVQRDELDNAFALLASFGSLRELQRQLRAHEAISGRSFDEIKEHVWEQEDEAAWEAVQEYLAEALIYGSKSFQLLSVSRDAKAAARSLADTTENLGVEEIIQLTDGKVPNSPTVAGILTSQASLTLVFRSRKTFIRSVPIETEWMLPEHRERIEGAEKAYLVETIRTPVLEAVEVPFGARHGSARIVTSLGGYTANESPDASSARLLSLTAQSLGVDEGEFTPIDLFPAIRNIYDDSSEGRVVEMHFDCSTGAGRVERMRRSSTDLRREAYHLAGVSAATINPYRIAVRWESTRFGYAEVALAGTRRMLHQTRRPRLTVAHVSPSSGQAAYLHVMQRIASKL